MISEYFPQKYERWHVIYLPSYEAALRIGSDIAHILDNVSLVAANIIYSPFSSSYSIKDAVELSEQTIKEFFALPVTVLLSPIKIALQTFYILQVPKQSHLFNLRVSSHIAHILNNVSLVAANIIYSPFSSSYSIKDAVELSKQTISENDKIPNLSSRWSAVHIPLCEAAIGILEDFSRIIFDIQKIKFHRIFSNNGFYNNIPRVVILTEMSLKGMGGLAVTIMFTPIKVALQTLYILKDPQATVAWNRFRPALDNELDKHIRASVENQIYGSQKKV